MKKSLKKLESLIILGNSLFSSQEEEFLKKKTAPSKWSQKEIFGHLIDSAINNLKRFTESQFSTEVFKIQAYKQDELVRINRYQEANSQDILLLWKLLNKQIYHVVNQMTDQHFKTLIELPNQELRNIEFLFLDYVEHLEHHLNQIRDYHK